MILKTIKKIIYSNSFLATAKAGFDHKTGRLPNKHLSDAKSILHVGGNIGQERFLYNYLDVNVAYIKPIPHIYNALLSNLNQYSGKQKAFNLFFHEFAGIKYELNVANNHGSASSIYDFKEHAEIWPDVEFTDKISVVSTTLDAFLSSKVWPFFPDTLVIDVQGAELDVLKGSEKSLKFIKWIQVEASDFDAYEGGCQVSDIESFLTNNNFSRVEKVKVSSSNNKTKNYFELIYINNNNSI